MTVKPVFFYYCTRQWLWRGGYINSPLRTPDSLSLLGGRIWSLQAMAPKCLSFFCLNLSERLISFAHQTGTLTHTGMLEAGTHLHRWQIVCEGSCTTWSHNLPPSIKWQTVLSSLPRTSKWDLQKVPPFPPTKRSGAQVLQFICMKPRLKPIK